MTHLLRGVRRISNAADGLVLALREIIGKVLTRSDEVSIDNFRHSIKRLETRQILRLMVELSNSVQIVRIVDSIRSRRFSQMPYSTFDTLFFGRFQPVERKEQRSFDSLMKTPIGSDKTPYRFRLDRLALISRPWDQQRLVDAIPMFGSKTKWVEQPDNHRGEILFPFPIIWVFNGNHSAAAGALNQDGIISAPRQGFDLWDISPIFDFVEVDGCGLFRKSDGSPLTRYGDNHWDWRFGLIWAMADEIRTRPNWKDDLLNWSAEQNLATG